MMKRGHNYSFIVWTSRKKIEQWWKFSVFGRYSQTLKVLAHEISGENPKKNNFDFNGMMNRGNSDFLSAWTSRKKLSGGGCFQFFCRNSRILKVLAHEISGEISKRFKIFDFNGMMKRGHHFVSQ